MKEKTKIGQQLHDVTFENLLPVSLVKLCKTQCQDEFRSLSGSVTEILTACRMLQISIAWCQIEAEIRGFPTMHIMGGRKYSKNWQKT